MQLNELLETHKSRHTIRFGRERWTEALWLARHRTLFLTARFLHLYYLASFVVLICLVLVAGRDSHLAVLHHCYGGVSCVLHLLSPSVKCFFPSLTPGSVLYIGLTLYWLQLLYYDIMEGLYSLHFVCGYILPSWRLSLYQNSKRESYRKLKLRRLIKANLFWIFLIFYPSISTDYRYITGWLDFHASLRPKALS